MSKVVEGGLADVAGKMQVGDKILSVSWKDNNSLFSAFTSFNSCIFA